MRKCLLKYSLACIMMVGGLCALKAQDIHFSQFYQSPLNLNPALTGVMDCNIRFVANYRNQWAAVLGDAAFNTYSVSYDQKFTAFQRDYFGLGATFWGDRAGEVDFATIQGRISGSFAKHLAGSRSSAHYLSVGVDFGLSSRNIDFAKAQWGSQNVNGVWQDIPSGENTENNSFSYADLSAGLVWFSTFDENTSFYIGGAYHHINTPSQSFNTSDDENDEVNIYAKYTLHAGGEVPISRNKRTTLIPGAVTFFQGPSFQVNAGTSARFQLGGSRFTKQFFQLGAWVRLVNMYDWNEDFVEDYSLGADAIILSTRFQYNTFDIGFSYDINVSDLRTGANGNGSFEFSLIYKICRPERRGVYCPTF